jgi:uncharacterized membrane protein YhaH (DUF805 family)
MRSRLAFWWVVGLGLCAGVQEAVITGGLHEVYPLLDLVFLASLAPLAAMVIALGVLLRRLATPVDSGRTTGGLAGSGLR